MAFAKTSKLQANRFLRAAVVSALTLMATAASADILTITYTGTVAGGFDRFDTWDTGNTELAGNAFTLVYSVDTSTGLHQSSGAPFAFDSYMGGQNCIGCGIPVTSVLTINGHSLSSSGTSISVAGNEQRTDNTGNNRSTTFQQTLDDTSNIHTFLLSTNPSTFPLPITGVPGVVIVDGTNVQSVNSGFAFLDPDPIDTFGRFSLAEVNFSDTIASVPETSTWAMLILGFAGLGFMACRRNRLAQNRTPTAIFPLRSCGVGA